MICPKCKAEYREGYTVCADCAVELVEALDPHALAEKRITGEVEIKGKKLTCPVCSGISFTSHHATLNEQMVTFLDLNWLNDSYVNYACNGCGYLFWFLNRPGLSHNRLGTTSPKDQDEAEFDYETSPVLPNECPNCFAPVTPGDRECGNCGHKLN